MGRLSWTVEGFAGSASAFHVRPLPDPMRRAVWWFTVDRPALVLGSTQSSDLVDERALTRTGVDVVRRHSGGGAVLLVPDEVTWVDVLLPANDPLWSDDVGQAFGWLGDTWMSTLLTLGVSSPVVHRGLMRRSALSDLVCFAGLGPGEITVGGRKVLGISQRRTRAGARFQCALLHHWDPDRLVGLLNLDANEQSQVSAALADAAAGVLGVGDLPRSADLRHTFERHLPR